ncbi:TonB-dependent receptor [Litoribrevibacter albus]|uniref:Amino acid ABC transporter substrate-binding protein n=1 Tax=Litoribrevibacter albus TaxID=1473156 RepID=A0AA37W596_9GAMM|nr:TonB-dependent receptor [Litoribrevibacter albus]GLQ30355.1 amino acid ABC transporter substrate-binding protein [Litoribrevibacter albus]
MNNNLATAWGIASAIMASSVFAEPSLQTDLPSQKDQTSQAEQPLVVYTSQFVVTGTREAQDKMKVAESVSSFDEFDNQSVSPSHPAELLNRSAGVHINNLGGEGHMTAIRQPITTKGVYLFLEDGIPTRPTGFFNHNGLYEVNIPQSDRLEVTKGPGSSLYGSEAIGGIINSMTKASPEEAEASGVVELGSYGWKRTLLSGGNAVSDDTGFRIDFNATDNSGYRQESDYSRYSSTVRVDSQLTNQLTSKTVMSYTFVDQSGVSELEEDDYKNNPKKNRFHDDIGYREVNAFRLSNEFNVEINEDTLVSVIPFYRNNTTEMMPSWMVTYDPNIRETKFQSFGLMSKYRQNFWQGKATAIAGVDIDYSPSSFKEDKITVTKEGDIYTDYQKTGQLNYDYDADQLSVSPYVHTEFQVHDQVRLTAGLRYDYFDVDYDDNLEDQAVDARHLRPESQSVDFDELSPKLGAVYQFSRHHMAYANYRHAFRAPSVGQLFRSGSSINTDELQPVTSDSYEIGFRGNITPQHSYEIAVYHMTVEDDIVTYIDGSDRKTTNAGETTHKGVEISLNGDLTEEFKYGVAASYSKQEYKDFQYVYGYYSGGCRCYVQETRNFEGFDVAKAPRTLANAHVNYLPIFLPQASFELEWEHLGNYYTDETNTEKYSGHNLFNLRGEYELTENAVLFGRVMNLFDKRYSTYTSTQVGKTDTVYRPGNPMTGVVGVRLNF